MRGPISIALSGAIGLGTEAVAAYKNRHHEATGDHEYDDEEHHAWMCDDVQNHIESGVSNGTDHDEWEPPSYSKVTGQLPAAVIIPQRRPHSKTRGFVRAYAPALNDCGIDQVLFLQFLGGFDAAIKKQGLFFVANLPVAAGVLTSTIILGHNPLVDLAGVLVHASVEAGRRMYVAHKTKDYLSDMNEKLFKPRGLYALIMTYDPASPNAFAMVDISTVELKAVAVQKGGGTHNKFQVASGTTHGEAQMPQTVPLVFPYLDAAGDEQKQNAFKKAGTFLNDYGDRRAQAKFEAANPDSSLNITPAKHFSSRYADPNHAVNKGGPLAVLTGGVISPDNKKRERKEQHEREVVAQGGQLPVKKDGLKKRLLSENVLYLMIVNMPTEEQLRAVAEVDEKMGLTAMK